jgi:hypothetical protein
VIPAVVCPAEHVVMQLAIVSGATPESAGGWRQSLKQDAMSSQSVFPASPTGSDVQAMF